MKKVIFLFLFTFGMLLTSAANNAVNNDSISQEESSHAEIKFTSNLGLENGDQEDAAIGHLFDMATYQIGNAITGMLIIFIVFFILVLFVLTLYFVTRYKRNKQRQEMIMKCIESGQPIPPFLLEDQNKKSRYLTNGVVWIAIGAALLFLAFELAVIPLFIGLAFFVLYFIAKRNTKDNSNEQGQSE